MERILLLEACCFAETIRCEENELVACAASEGHPAGSFCWTGGFWTKKLWSTLDETLTYDLEELLQDVKYELEKEKKGSFMDSSITQNLL